MRISVFAFVAWLIVSVSGFAEPGAYERLWYWYAYQLDTFGKTIAPGCAKAPNRCTFQDFLKYINMGDTINYDALNGVNTDNVDDTITKLKNAQATGAYDCTRVYQSSTMGKNEVAALMDKVGDFCARQVGSAPDTLKTNLQHVTVAVSKGRQAASLSAHTSKLQGDGYTVATRDVPVFEGSTDSITTIDPRTTVNNSPGKTMNGLRTWLAIEQANDPGHTNNVKSARAAAGSISAGCTPGAA